MASGATRVGRTRDFCFRPPVPSPLECGMRREPAPGHFAGQAEIVQILGFVARHARGQNLGFPRGRREFAALQLADDLQRAVDAVQLAARRRGAASGGERR